jgi:nitronate monooxygenase
MMPPLVATPGVAHVPPLAALDRAAIEDVLRSGRRLLVQGAMGIHASDGLAGKVARHRGQRLVGVGTISGVLKTDEQLRAEIVRARREAPGGFVGVNLMAAIDKRDFARLAAVAVEERVSFVVQGAGISREIVRWCRDGGVPFAGIVSSGRLAAMYEKWGASFLVAEGARAGGHIGDIGHELPALLAEVRAASSLPVVAAGGVEPAEVVAHLAAGAAGVQLATRFLACADGDVHPAFKDMHLRRGGEDVVVITSCVKGMKARAVRNAFTDRLARGEAFPPRSKAWYFGREGYAGRRKACIECLAEGLCRCRTSGFKESFCITDALLLSAIKGDRENGLFYSGQSVTGISDRDPAALPTAEELLSDLEARLAEADPGVRKAALA